MDRNIARRIARLEARAGAAANIPSRSVLIRFVDPEKGVTSTLLMESGRRVWTNLEGEARESSRSPTAE